MFLWVSEFEYKQLVTGKKIFAYRNKPANKPDAKQIEIPREQISNLTLPIVTVDPKKKAS